MHRGQGPGATARAFLFYCLALLALLPNAAAADALELSLSGVSDEMADNIRAFLSLTPLAQSDDADPSRIRRAHRRARAEIRQALQPFGYYTPTIDASLERRDGAWHARYAIEPGPPTRIAALELRVEGPGADDSALQAVVADSGLAEGARLDHAAYRTTRQQLVERAIERGYLEARLSRHRIEVNPTAHTARVALVLATGPAFYFGEVRIEQSILRPDFVAGYVPVEAGQRLTSARLLDLQFALSDSSYFRRVEVDVRKAAGEPYRPPEAEAAREGRKVPVVIDTEPRASRRYRIGVGYGTDTGPRLTTGIEFRRLNRRGHRARIDMLLSPVKRNVASQYTIPIGNVRTDQMTFSAALNQEEFGDGRSTKTTIGVSRDILWRGWRRNLYAKYALERFIFSGDTTESRLLTPGVSLSRKVADDPLFPRRGWSLFLDVHGANDDFLADTTFTQLRARANGVWPLGPRMRLLGRAEAGGTLLDDFAELPASERFYAGGDRSVRGYAYQSLGPENADGDVVGGEHLVVVSAEADVRVWGRWGVAAFYDAGNASNAWPPELAAGAGGGLRWASPIGMIRLDYAVPLDQRDEDWRIHFSMGPDL
ncbi:MAG TPA: outer membrane protein assembly factor [Gammaproteobacteria bacterium]|nr:outer membrane protein assembly factor [Gammaproteobacteria bacterium]